MDIPKLADIKNWSTETERKITAEWKKNTYGFNSKTKKKIYSIDTPPPYVNTPIHMGHAVTYTYMDFFARYKRMKGYEVLFPLGLDRNGLPIEIAAEKKFNASPFHVGREKFIELCEQLLKEASTESIESFANLGISFSSYEQGKSPGNIYHTDAPEYRALTQSTFLNLFKENLIYEDARINNWDTKLQTTVADSEIEYKDIPSSFNHIKFKVKETGEEIVIATTRPELICTCKMIIYAPDDERYQNLDGLTAITPMYEKEVPIQEHPFAKKEKGTGLVMMCSAGDVTDIQFFREMRLEPVIAITKEGKMNAHAGFLEGLKVKQARETMINELKEHDLLVKQETITHRTPVSERSGAEIEFIEMPEFYLKQIDIKEDLKKILNDINFYPPESRKILDVWIDSVSIDWPISRRRFYATPVPLWRSGNYVAVPPQGPYYQPWKESVPQDSEVFENSTLKGKIKDKQFSTLVWKGEERVFDTWFDSSISELFLGKYQENPAFFKKAYPFSLRPQGKEIVRTWLYYTLLRGYIETEKAAFKDVWIHQHVLDEKGKKMSKSLGNVIDPKDILKNEGAEAFRLWSAIEGDISKGDIMCSRERIKAETKTITKLLNISRFIIQFNKPKTKPTLTKLDKSIISSIDYLTSLADKHYEQYDFHEPALKIRQFVWELFASHYIELVKARAYNEQGTFSAAESNSAKYTLYYTLERVITLLYPIIPQVTSVIAHALKVDFKSFPKISSKEKVDQKELEALMHFNSEIWKKKKKTDFH